MDVAFIDQDGIWDNSTQVVRFFAKDRSHSVMFTISLEALRELEPRAGLDGVEAILGVYQKNLARIRRVAAATHGEIGPGSSAAYALRVGHFQALA